MISTHDGPRAGRRGQSHQDAQFVEGLVAEKQTSRGAPGIFGGRASHRGKRASGGFGVVLHRASRKCQECRWEPGVPAGFSRREESNLTQESAAPVRKHRPISRLAGWAVGCRRAFALVWCPNISQVPTQHNQGQPSCGTQSRCACLSSKTEVVPVLRPAALFNFGFATETRRCFAVIGREVNAPTSRNGIVDSKNSTTKQGNPRTTRR